MKIPTIQAVNFRANNQKEPFSIPAKINRSIAVSAIQTMHATQNPNVVFINSDIYVLKTDIEEYFELHW